MSTHEQSVAEDQVTAEETRAEHALQLHASGMGWGQVAERTGYASGLGASRATRALIRKHEAQTVAELRAVEGARLDLVVRAMLPRALRGDVGAAGAVLKAVNTRAKLFGLYAPTEVAVGVGTGDFGDLLDRVAALYETTEVVDGESDATPALTQKDLAPFTEAELPPPRRFRVPVPEDYPRYSAPGKAAVARAKPRDPVTGRFLTKAEIAEMESAS